MSEDAGAIAIEFVRWCRDEGMSIDDVLAAIKSPHRTTWPRTWDGVLSEVAMTWKVMNPQRRLRRVA